MNKEHHHVLMTPHSTRQRERERPRDGEEREEGTTAGLKVGVNRERGGGDNEKEGGVERDTETGMINDREGRDGGREAERRDGGG